MSISITISGDTGADVRDQLLALLNVYGADAPPAPSKTVNIFTKKLAEKAANGNTAAVETDDETEEPAAEKTTPPKATKAPAKTAATKTPAAAAGDDPYTKESDFTDEDLRKITYASGAKNAPKVQEILKEFKVNRIPDIKDADRAAYVEKVKQLDGWAVPAKK